eukprot:scaffold41755_cov46-Cyclotella_meneghiniana.AAC.4
MKRGICSYREGEAAFDLYDSCIEQKEGDDERTESDEYSPGLMEDAVGSAHRVVEEILRQYHS